MFQRIRCYSLPFNIQVSFHNFKILLRETFLFQIDIKSSTKKKKITLNPTYNGLGLICLHFTGSSAETGVHLISYFYIIQIQNSLRLHITCTCNNRMKILSITIYFNIILSIIKLHCKFIVIKRIIKTISISLIHLMNM